MKGTTKSEDVRWRYLASIITFVILSSLCVLVVGASVGFLSLGVIPQSFFLLYATAVSTALVWIYGAEVYNVVTKND